MRVVQVANFYGPRSGGLRTAVDRLGAEYCAGVTRISLPARLIPFTGGYRAVLPRPVTSLLEDLEPDAIEVSDRLTLRSLGCWGRRHDVATVMISHERLDRLVGQILPLRVARTIADVANRRPVVFQDLMNVFGVLLAPLLGERRNGNPDHASVVGGIQIQIRRPNSFVDRSDQRDVIRLDGDQRWIRSGKLSDLVYGSGSAVVVDLNIVQD